jgi:hypothetical protein
MNKTQILISENPDEIMEIIEEYCNILAKEEEMKFEVVEN